MAITLSGREGSPVDPPRVFPSVMGGGIEAREVERLVSPPARGNCIREEQQVDECPSPFVQRCGNPFRDGVFLSVQQVDEKAAELAVELPSLAELADQLPCRPIDRGPGSRRPRARGGLSQLP